DGCARRDADATFCGLTHAFDDQIEGIDPANRRISSAGSTVQTDDQLVDTVRYVVNLFADKQAVGQQKHTHALGTKSLCDFRPARMLHRFAAAEDSPANA